MCYKKSNISFHPNLGKLTRHHRLAKSRKGCGLPRNISYVPEKLHNAFHLLFGTGIPTEIAKTLNDHWVDPQYHIIAVNKDDLPEFTQCMECFVWYRTDEKLCPNC